MDPQNAAETLALEAITWLIGDEDLRPVFLGATGLSDADLRGRVQEPDLLAAVLDFLLLDDAWVIRFCDTHGRAYTEPHSARAALPGGAVVHWT